MISFAGTGGGVWSVALQIAYVEGSVPGADLVLSLIIGLIVSLPFAVVYGWLASAIPRSGGDYVWSSRLLNPTFGFMFGWAAWACLEISLGGNTVLWGATALPNTLSSFGYWSGNTSLVDLAASLSQTTSVVIAGLVLLVVCAVLAIQSRKRLSRIFAIFFALIFLGSVAFCVILASSSHADFVNALNGYGGTNLSYDSIISQAKTNGWSFTPIRWELTVASLPMAMLGLAGFTNCSLTSGEVRNPRSNMVPVIVGSLMMVFGVTALGCWLSVNVLGNEFLQAVAHVGSAWPLVAPPWMPIFVTMLTHNLLLLVLVQAGFLTFFLFWTTSLYIINTRYVFAFAFDRVFPASMAEVSDRFHGPVNATFFNFVAAAVLFVIAVYGTGGLSALLNGTTLTSIYTGAGCLVAIIIPYTSKKGLVAHLPGSHWRVPLISIVGFIAFVLIGPLTFYYAVTVPAIGPSTPLSDVILVGILIVGALVFAVRYYYLKLRGIDLGMVYKKIPPE